MSSTRVLSSQQFVVFPSVTILGNVLGRSVVELTFWRLDTVARLACPARLNRQPIAFYVYMTVCLDLSKFTHRSLE